MDKNKIPKAFSAVDAKCLSMKCSSSLDPTNTTTEMSLTEAKAPGAFECSQDASVAWFITESFRGFHIFSM